MTRSEARASVLVVEDEGIVALDLQQTLGELGYDGFAVASSAEQALQIAAARRPDVVLMDIRIEGPIDGVDAAAAFRERFAVPVVFLTAHADESTVDRAKRVQPVGYLVKPVQSTELRGAIEVALFRHEMERRLRERERWFATTLRCIGDAVVAIDETGRVAYVNPSAERLLQIEAAAVLGQPIVSLEGLRGADRTEAALTRALRDQRDLPTEETRLPDGLGGTRVVLETASLVLDGRELLGAVSVIRDITEQRRLEERVASADRLAALGTIAAGIAHAINNPLAVLSGHSDLLLQTLEQRRDELPFGASAERTSVDEMIAGQVDCVDAIRRIAGVIGDLRSFAARPDTTRAGANIAEAIAHAVRSTAPRLVGRARIDLDDGIPGAHAAIARPHLEQVVAHLLTNAAQASPVGRPDDHPITLVVRRAGAFVTIEVRDRGAGLAPDVAKRVFEPFFTTREVGRGSGLGLAICHGLVTRARGHIECESELGRGATFRITLPEASPSSPSSA